jgi:rsbT co-antagonist protein RsbR
MPQLALVTLQQTLQLTDLNIERRKRFVGLEVADLPRIAAVRAIVAQRTDEFTEVFFNFLRGLEEASALFRNETLLEEAKRRERDHLAAMVDGVYDRAYVEQRLELGYLYSRVNLDTRVFLGAFHHLMRAISVSILANARDDALAANESFMSVQKVGFFDIGLVVDIMAAERERIIGVQQDAIRELSTPVLRIRDRLLILPIIGVFDSFRAKQLTDSLLQAIRANRAQVVVMDITGVVAIDSKVANHLIQTIAASRLMGATVIVTGLSADVAQALVALGVDLNALNTVGDLQGGLVMAERNLGYKVVRQTDAALEMA